MTQTPRRTEQRPHSLLRTAAAIGILGAVAALALRSRREREVSQALTRLRARHAADAQRAHALDHAMRTPLGTLAAACELLQLPDSDAALQAEASEVIQRQLSQLRSLAEALREFARGMDE